MTEDEAPTPAEEEWEEQVEDAEIRHDEGYVETFGNEQTDEPAEARADARRARPGIRGADPGAPGRVDPGRRGPRVRVRRRIGGTGAPGAGPEGWKVKGNADSLLFYTEDAPTYSRSAADVWFETEEAATSAGFTRWDAHHR